MYEILFTYYERTEDGKYNTEEEKTFTKNLGKKGSVELSKVASYIFSQLARRDIWITKTEISEYAKREISFKEVKNGIIIKNKKFAYDDMQKDIVEVEVEPEVTIPSKKQNTKVVQQTSFQDGKNYIRYEIFIPTKEDMAYFRSTEIKLTPNKKYGIIKEFSENPNDLRSPIFYTLEDDTGKEVEVSSTTFEPERKLLTYESVEPENYSASNAYNEFFARQDRILGRRK